MKSMPIKRITNGAQAVRNKRKSFTLIELLVVIATIAILASLLLPALKNAQGVSKRTVCLSNMKQIGLGVMGYIDDHNGWIPSRGMIYPSGWLLYDAPTAIEPYVPRAMWECPAATFATQSKPYLQIGWEAAMGYGGLFRWRNTRMFNIPSKVCYAGDTNVPTKDLNQKGWYYGASYICTEYYYYAEMRTSFRHNNMWNGYFMDGHGKSYSSRAQFQEESVKDFFELW